MTNKAVAYQKVRLARLKTTNDEFDFTESGTKIGLEFFVKPESTLYTEITRKATGEKFYAITVVAEFSPIRIPVELLDYLGEWEIRSEPR